MSGYRGENINCTVRDWGLSSGRLLYNQNKNKVLSSFPSFPRLLGCFLTRVARADELPLSGRSVEKSKWKGLHRVSIIVYVR